VFEAVNAVMGGYESLVGLPAAAPGTSLQAAIGQAARGTLAALFPSQASIMDGYLASPPSPTKRCAGSWCARSAGC
jgi:hypothetical protein